MGWFKRMEAPGVKGDRKASVPTGLWKKCPQCGAPLLAEEVAQNDQVCGHCDHHFRVGARERLLRFADPDSLEEFAGDLSASDPLSFVDSKPYAERLETTQAKLGERDAFVAAEARLHGHRVVVGAFEFQFMGGSMGTVVGEKVALMFERGLERKVPVILFSASGGARMQEGILSLMQMAKTAAAIDQFRRAGMPYISVLTDPTTGGVAASFAMLGDIIVAEPGALIGFAGPRVIEQTIRQKLPEGFQRSEFLLEHGAIDMVVHRRQLREQIAHLVDMILD